MMLCLVVILTTLCLQAILTKPSKTFIENIRAQKSLEMIRTKSCEALIGDSNCTHIKNQLPHQMQFFMAKKIDTKFKVVTIKSTQLVSSLMDVKNLDGVVVIDPIPEAHYGHTTVVLLIRTKLTKTECNQLKGFYYSGPSDFGHECMFLPDFNRCQIYIKLKKKDQQACQFQSIPRVYDTDGGEDLLECFPEIEGFGQCPLVKFKKNSQCENRRNCQSGNHDTKSTCYSSCDYALMLSGGWNKFTNKYRHLLNLRDMFRYLHVKKSFPRDNIKVFFANNSTVELDGDKTTRDATPATDRGSILNEIKTVCRKQSSCLDTFVIYLNGPTLPNGNILLWDKNKNGIAEDSEIITVKELIQPFRSCNAQNILIIADQNFAGHIIDEVVSQRDMGNIKMKTVSVITASTKKSYSWRRDFTERFIEFDNVNIDSKTDTAPSRRISAIFNDLKKSLASEYRIKYLHGHDPDLTVTGKYGSEAGCKTNLDPLKHATQWETTKERTGGRRKRSIFQMLNKAEKELPYAQGT